MNVAPNSVAGPRELGRLLAVYWRRWVAVALLAAGATVAYVLMAPKTWQASQALIVRNEAVGNETDSGKFRGAEDLKSIEETILELSKSRGVLEATLRETGLPVGDARPSDWPTDRNIESLQRAVKIVPPKGLEFGASEVFYLEVCDQDRARAARLSSALCRHLQLHLQEIRDAKAQSMIGELDKAVQLARSDLYAATVKLTAMEKEVGSDLPELRSLLDANSSDTSLRRTVSEIESELRQSRATEKANRQLLALLEQAQADPARLMAAPNRLLESQPVLRRLKEGLVDAQLRTAALQSRMSAEHPAVVSAKETEVLVAGRLHAELSAAIRSLQSELALDANRLEMLEHQRSDAAARLTRLAALRATYMNVLSEATNRARLLDRAEQNLASARSDSASAKAASLITCVGAPDTGASPVGPSNATIVLAGVLGGLLAGIGLVWLTAPAAAAATAERQTTLPVVAAVPTTMPAPVLPPYAVPIPQQAAALPPRGEPWSKTVATHGSLNCTRALKVLNEQGKLSGASVS